MPPDVAIPLALAMLVALLAAGAFWAVGCHRLRRDPAARPTLRAADGEPLPVGADGRPELVSVIVPAHDEARVIDACARALRAQDHPALEFVFVLDRCTDATLDLLRPHAEADPRVRIVENRDCPPDWAGKCNAARRGAETARGDWLVFTDADVRFAPDLARTAVALAHARGADLLSLLPHLTRDHPFERIAQPTASLMLGLIYPIDRVDRGPESRPFANGQFMLFRRAFYDRLGGHARVKEALLEDLAFARAVHADGGRVVAALAEERLVVSMYDSYEAFRRGWKRILIDACHRKPSRLRRYAWRLLLLGPGLALLVLAALALAATLLLGDHGALGRVLGAALAAAALGFVALAGSVLAVFWRGCGARPRDLAWFPLGCIAVAGIMREAARDLRRRVPVRWGGKEYVLEPRD